MAEYQVELWEHDVAFGFKHAFWVIRSSTGTVLAEFHGFATDLVTGQAQSFGHDGNQLASYMFDYAAFSTYENSRVLITSTISTTDIGNFSVQNRDGSIANFNAVPAWFGECIDFHNTFNQDFVAMYRGYSWQSQNSNSVARAFADVCGDAAGVDLLNLLPDGRVDDFPGWGWELVDESNELRPENVLEVDDAPPPPGVDRCFAEGTKIVMGDGTTRAIEEIMVGDDVLSFNEYKYFGRGELKSARVSAVHSNHDKVVIDFHGTLVTPGHVYLDGVGRYRSLIDILESDGIVVSEDGIPIRARTGWPVGSSADALAIVGFFDHEGRIKTGKMRLGQAFALRSGTFYSLAAYMLERGYHPAENGRFLSKIGACMTAFWLGGPPDPRFFAEMHASYPRNIPFRVSLGLPFQLITDVPQHLPEPLSRAATAL